MLLGCGLSATGGAGAPIFVPDGRGVAVEVPIFFSTTLMLLLLVPLVVAVLLLLLLSCLLSGRCCTMCCLYCFQLASP